MGREKANLTRPGVTLARGRNTGFIRRGEILSPPTPRRKSGVISIYAV